METADWSDKRIDRTIKKLIELFKNSNEFFEDGMESNFSRTFVDIITPAPPKLYELLSPYLWYGYNRQDTRINGISITVVAEALTWINYIENDNTLLKKKKILEEALYARHHYIRDAAMTGIDILSNPASLTAIVRAYSFEKIEPYRQILSKSIINIKKIREEIEKKNPIY